MEEKINLSRDAEEEDGLTAPAENRHGFFWFAAAVIIGLKTFPFFRPAGLI